MFWKFLFSNFRIFQKESNSPHHSRVHFLLQTENFWPFETVVCLLILVVLVPLLSIISNVSVKILMLYVIEFEGFLFNFYCFA